MTRSRSVRPRIGLLQRWLPAIVVSLPLCGCTHLAVDDCGGKVLGEHQPRIRSSHFRVILSDLSAASNRFLDYAAMSSLAYLEDGDCGTKEGDKKISTSDAERLSQLLASQGWRENKEAQWVPTCEDNVGLFLRVFERDAGGTLEVAIAFRGTWGLKDWVYGNLHWITRLLPMDDQYSRARQVTTNVLSHYDKKQATTTRFFATGHSLGGGLAQHALYANPKKILQVVAFDPSSVTGFVDQSTENQIAGCACESSLPPGEPRIYRVYDAYEILANLRVFHKWFFAPERHVQEVRFPNEGSHSMLGLTYYFQESARSRQAPKQPWFSGRGEWSPGRSCTEAFIDAQVRSCSQQVTAASSSYCPQ